ncbi:conserved hypothetical protein [Pseudomonas protegens Pf-5]|uniref:Uncharacterized protein n=1 Tax=Pseudomonas fluorescens (strain ATCC BAA-477 / NRRL B-23932 / Pf-5) TaxID=220664 RepID=Q4KET2_PSEF5|nr:conserved hypothetical protein [Pseudomonas protegens Pf-5]
MMGPGTGVRGFKHRPQGLYVTRNPDSSGPGRPPRAAPRRAVAAALLIS